MQHISSDNHQNAISLKFINSNINFKNLENENITTKETQTKQQTTKGHFKCL